MVRGLDTNILCYSLDPAYPEHERLGGLLLGLSPENRVAINPTILHETYHTLVFGQKFEPSEAEERLRMLLRHPYVDFHNQTRRISLIALSLAVRNGLGGRDALIVANFMGNKVPTMYTHDRELLSLKRVTWRTNSIEFEDPLG
ncbi:MAG: PIN domain-containing protein [Deltaproteobacteria bacterium]|nr:PIN domain-containing protein [Deltaproteobacteria bacterium]